VVSNIFYVPFHIWDVILPIDELHHFSGRSTTNQENRETLFKSAPKKNLYDLMTTELDEFLLGKVAAEAWRPHFSAAFCWGTSLSQSGPGNQWKPMETHQSF
jgi:hypothetical protein